MKKDYFILKVYKGLIWVLLVISTLGVLGIPFLFQKETFDVAVTLITTACYALSTAGLLQGLYYIVKAACIYIEKNTNPTTENE